MCLDIAFYSALELIDEYFPDLVHDQEIDFDLDMSVHVLAMGYKRYPVLVFEDGQYKRKYFEWCIIPEYMNTPEKIKKGRPFMANFRTEKLVDDKKSFWHKIRKQRCLIPMTGIYEHREIQGWKNKVPYHIQLKDRDMFCIPGLFHYNKNVPSDPETGEMRGMFSLGTRWGNEVMKQIHNGGENAFRMPLFLPKEMELKWLNPAETDDDLREIVNFEMPSSEIVYKTVYSIRGRTPRPDGKPKNEAYEFPGLPPLGNDQGLITTQVELF
jgi:putative SOS response-associated peptidase YedK